METIGIFNNENISPEELAQFRHRRAVRAIVFDNDKNIALLHSPLKNYYGIPGGGVEENENFEAGVIRECKEEIGCDVKIIKELGKTFEYRKNDNLINESWGYAVHIIGEKGLPIFIGDENELEKSSTILWVPISKAIELLENTPKGTYLYGQYITNRDLVFLKKAKEITTEK